MNTEDFTVGARVRLINRIGGKYLGAMYDIAAGATGTVSVVSPDASEEDGEPFAHVTLDQHEPDLDDWDNDVHVWRNLAGDATPDDFEMIVGFGT